MNLIKKTLLTVLSLTLGASAYADLGDTRAQIEAKYGKEILPDLSSFPASIQGADGKEYKRPKGYFLSEYDDHRDNTDHQIGVGVHYNAKSIVTAVSYTSRIAKVGEFSTMTKNGFNDDDLKYFLWSNGLKGEWHLSEFPNVGGAGPQPLYRLDWERHYFIEIQRSGWMDYSLYSGFEGKEEREKEEQEAKKKETVDTIIIWNAEALADEIADQRKWHDFKEAIASNRELSVEVSKKEQARIDRDEKELDQKVKEIKRLTGETN